MAAQLAVDGGVGSDGAVGPAEPGLSRATVGVLWLLGILSVLTVGAWLFGRGIMGLDRPVVAAAGSPSPYLLGGPASSPTASGGVALITTTPATTASATGRPGAAATQGASPTATPTQVPLLQPAPATATAAPAVTQGAAYALIQAPTNLRWGPGPNYSILTVLQPGDQAPITGRSQDGNWWQVRSAGGQTGWVFTSLVAVRGGTDQVPVVAGPDTNGPTPIPPIPPLSTAEVASPSPTPAPTATPRPTATASATAAATATPAPTATTAPQAQVPADCPTQPAGPFANLPGGQDRLGCPVAGTASTDFAHQYFQGGQMIYRHDLRTVYVLYSDGTWAAFRDNYVEGQPMQAHEYNPPDGMKQPIKGFDRVWEQKAVRARLGWATGDEQSVIQGEGEPFQRGQALWINRSGYLTAYFLLLADGTWLQL
jgi:uncharacterized protein YraI